MGGRWSEYIEGWEGGELEGGEWKGDEWDGSENMRGVGGR